MILEFGHGEGRATGDGEVDFWRREVGDGEGVFHFSALARAVCRRIHLHCFDKFFDHTFLHWSTGHDESHVQKLDDACHPFVTSDRRLVIGICQVRLYGQNSLDNAGVCVEPSPAYGNGAEWK